MSSGSWWKFTLFQAIGVFAFQACLWGIDPNEVYRVWEAGQERLFTVAGNRRLTAPDSGERLEADPSVIVPCPSASKLHSLSRRYLPASIDPSGVGGMYVFSYSTLPEALAAASAMWLDGIKASPIVYRRQQPRFLPRDPLYRQQWHLRNRGSLGGLRKNDLNIEPAWKMALGRGVVVGVVDDGLEIGHPDISANAAQAAKGRGNSLHYDFVRNSPNPRPGKQDDHGTAVAGLIAAASNKRGGVGVAPRARLAGLRLLGGSVSDRNEARALGHRSSRIDIYNCSWGPSDAGDVVRGPGPLVQATLSRAVRFGRAGRGNIFVWSSGNGRADLDDANYDGYANAPETIAVGSISDRGRRASDSEAGANLVVCAPSSSQGRQGLTTTDRQGRFGYNRNGENDGSVRPRRNLPDRDYTNDFGGTSGSAPLVSGVVALMLEANPKLGWREVQDALIRTARKVDPKSAGWRKNGAGLWFHHGYGAGLVDAGAAVRRARQMRRMGAPLQLQMASGKVGRKIPDANRSGIVLEFDLSAEKDLKVEHVQFIVSVRHDYRGDLRYELTSPSGTRSEVSARPFDSGDRLAQWPFMSVHHWGEPSRGVWRLRVIDTSKGISGVLEEAALLVRGTMRTKT